MNTEPLIRVSISINRKEGTTEVEFHKYWANVHAPMVQEWLIRCGVLKYVQVSFISRSLVRVGM